MQWRGLSLSLHTTRRFLGGRPSLPLARHFGISPPSLNTGAMVVVRQGLERLLEIPGNSGWMDGRWIDDGWMMDGWMDGVYEGAPCREGVGGSNQAVPSNPWVVCVGHVGTCGLALNECGHGCDSFTTKRRQRRGGH